MRELASLFGLLSTLGLWAGAAELPKNVSSISYEQTAINDDRVVGTCSGLIDDAAGLTKMGISKAKLKQGVRCVVGDFDGNGYVDFAFAATRRHEELNGRRSHSQDFVIIYFFKKQILKNELIEHPRSTDGLALYPPRKKEGQNGGPPTKTPGLVDWGEGARNIFYIYDPQRKHMVMSESSGESG